MPTDLVRWINTRLDNDVKLSDDAKLLILAALEGKDALADMAGFEPPVALAEDGASVEPVGAFLKQIKVEGFRGIGPQAQLDLDPVPSLTVISGRNGSGKSSFAEALEVALTGTTYRWRSRASQWKEQWRNIHEGGCTRIEVTLAEEAVGKTKLTAKWPPAGELEEMVISLQRNGEKKQTGIESLGWAKPLEMYRPLLTYEELGALLASEPKVLYDAIATLLGLEQLADAVNNLAALKKDLVAPEHALKKEKRELSQALSQLTDDRATQAQTLLAARTQDVHRLRSLATGQTDDGGIGGRVRSLLALQVPDAKSRAAAADDLKEAVEKLALEAKVIGEEMETRAAFLAAAVAFHEQHGDQKCPICEQGELDTARASQLRALLEDEQRLMIQLQTSRKRYHDMQGKARSLVLPRPPVLAMEFPEPLSQSVTRLAASWGIWSQVPDEPLALAEHLTTKGDPLARDLIALQQAVTNYLSELDETWSRLASRLATYADNAESWEASKAHTAQVTAAHKWLKDNEILLKNERVKPIAEEARKIWAGLRQESNVEIAGLTLESSNTRRHVVIAAEVDGEEAGALAVMSQGELHALALSLFLPRATMPESPFRFVVLDDPVQAMDPAKVDGLVKVLLEIARTRQVVVFSHDDRFASAVRRAPRDVPVKVMEVVRQAGSKVSTTITYSPADRYLNDAFGVVMDSALPQDTLLRVLPGLLRMALEAQARETYFSRELAAGGVHENLEQAWDKASRTRERLGLAIGDPGRIDVWLDKAGYRRWAVKKSNSIHYMLEHGEPIDACRDVEKTIRDIRQGVK